MQPTVGRILHYRGSQGLQTLRAAIVTATVDTLDPRGVAEGHVKALTTADHVHLWVYTPSDAGGFPEYNVPPTSSTSIDPGTWAWPTIT